MYAKSLSWIQLCVTLWTVALQAPLFIGFPRQEYGKELPFHSPAYLPDPGIEPMPSASAGVFFTTVSRYAVFISVSLVHFTVLDS